MPSHTPQERRRRARARVAGRTRPVRRAPARRRTGRLRRRIRRTR